MTQLAKYEVRDMRDGEEDILWRLFHETVRAVNLGDYSQSQVAAWSPEDRDMQLWRQRMAEISPFVALVQDGGSGGENGDNGETEETIVGYADLQADGLIDHLFVHRDWQGQGVAGRLMAEIEHRARNLRLRELHAFVSITARPMFEHFGFVVERDNQVDMKGITLTNYLMRRAL